jgi:hypothetical protein
MCFVVFRNTRFFTLSKHTNGGGLPIVCCPLLLIQSVRAHTLYNGGEIFSSIYFVRFAVTQFMIIT